MSVTEQTMKQYFLFHVGIVVAFGAYGTALADDAAKPLILEKSGPVRKLPERLLGGSAESLIEHLIDDPRKVAALKDLDLAFVRFPGGSQANTGEQGCST